MQDLSSSDPVVPLPDHIATGPPRNTPPSTIAFNGEGASPWRLTVLDPLGHPHSSLLPYGVVALGRSPSADFTIPNDLCLDGKHIKLSAERRHLLLCDLGSANGTWLRLREPIPLQVGDEVIVGTSLMRIVRAAAEGGGQ